MACLLGQPTCPFFSAQKPKYLVADTILATLD